MNGLFDFEFDLVVSGINSGANLGDDVLYSGTVGAAFEGRLMKQPAIAVSLAGLMYVHTTIKMIMRKQLNGYMTLLQKDYLHCHRDIF